MNLLTEIDEILQRWSFPRDVWDCLTPYEQSFVRIEFSGDRSPHYYEQRLRAVGFTGHESILDAGCGMGQWVLAAARLNSHVTGIDLNSERLLIARDLVRSNGANNVSLRWSPMESVPLADESQGAVLSYGAMMFSHMKQTLREFRRVLLPGGRLYFNVSSYGWYAHLLIDRGVRQRQKTMIRAAGRAALRTMWGSDKDRIVSRRWLLKLIERAGFSVIAEGPEESINIENDVRLLGTPPPQRLYGMRSRFEVLASKTPN